MKEQGEEKGSDGEGETVKKAMYMCGASVEHGDIYLWLLLLHTSVLFPSHL